jgi:methionyl-tRNA synthetase
VEKEEAPAKQEKTAKKNKQEKKADKKEQADENAEISIDDFAKIHLRVVKVLAAEPVPKTEKLLKLTVDLGDEQREIVSGIAKHYEPADLVGKNVVMVINLKPAKIRGIVSHGMVLAASQGDDLKVLSVDMPVGSTVR